MEPDSNCIRLLSILWDYLNCTYLRPFANISTGGIAIDQVVEQLNVDLITTTGTIAIIVLAVY